jgi:hypothetical protein
VTLAPLYYPTVTFTAVNERRYNQPTADDIAAVLPGDGETDTVGRDIVVTTKGGYLRRVYETNPQYDPLHFVVLFPYGTWGWSFSLRRSNDEKVWSFLI